MLELCAYYLIHFLDSWAAGTPWGSAIHATAWHSTFGHATAASCLVDLHHDWVHDTLKLLLFRLELILLSHRVLVEPVECFLNCLLNLVLVVAFELLFEFLLLERVAHGEAVVFQAILGLDLAFAQLVLCPELLSLLHHTIDFRLRQTPLFVGDGDLVGFS